MINLMRLDDLCMAPTFKRMMQDRNARMAARVQEHRIAAKAVRFTAPPSAPLAQPTPAPALFNDDVLSYILAGRATFTLESDATGNRHTFKITQADARDPQDAPAWFVAHLTGPDNESSYQYLGLIKEGTYRPNYRRVAEDAPSQKAAVWFLKRVLANQPTPGLTLHKGRTCARCGRLLTTPQSIALGLGPECANKALG